MSQTQTTLFSDNALDPPLKRIHSVDVITTVNGGSDTAYAAARSGVKVGIRSNYRRPPDDVPIEFVDWPFTEIEGPDDVEAAFRKHLAVVEREQPKYAVAPDVDENVGYNEAVRYAVQLDEHCDTVIMVPKSIHPLDVPRKFRVGMPCQERFGGTPYPWSEYRDCKEVHLLGGDPTKQFEVEKYYVPVRSIDTAVPISRATWGKVWTFSERQFIRKSEGFYGSIEESFSNIWTEWNGVNVCLGRLERMKYPKPKSGNRRYDDDPLDVEAYLAPDEEIPFPGRAWCYENDVREWRERNRTRTDQVEI